MISTDNNINNNSQIKEIDIQSVLSDITYRVEPVTQEEYDRRTFYDPTTVYVIIDVDDGRMYLGEMLIKSSHIDRMYLMSYDFAHDKYVIYINQVFNHRDNLIPIAQYDDAQKAINAIRTFNTIGEHNQVPYKILSAVTSYIDKMAGLNETIISIIALLGYRDDSRLQYLNEVAISYGTELQQRDISELHRQMLHNLKDRDKDTLVPLYSDIYDLFVEFNMFKGKDSIEDLDNNDFRKFLSKLLKIYRNR